MVGILLLAPVLLGVAVCIYWYVIIVPVLSQRFTPEMAPSEACAYGGARCLYVILTQPVSEVRL